MLAGALSEQRLFIWPILHVGRHASWAAALLPAGRRGPGKLDSVVGKPQQQRSPQMLQSVWGGLTIHKDYWVDKVPGPITGTTGPRGLRLREQARQPIGK